MKRGDLYRVYQPGGGDPKRYRTFVVVSRQALVDSRYSSVVCAPIFSRGHELSTQVPVNANEGLKHSSWIMCDNLTSLNKADLTSYVGSLSPSKLSELDRALKMALDLR